MIISKRTVKSTRKNHWCAGCGSVMGAGSQMDCTNESVDGRLQAVYWCSICVEFMQTLDQGDLADGFTDMWEYDGYSEFRQTTISLSEAPAL